MPLMGRPCLGMALWPWPFACFLIDYLLCQRQGCSLLTSDSGCKKKKVNSKGEDGGVPSIKGSFGVTDGGSGNFPESRESGWGIPRESVKRQAPQWSQGSVGSTTEKAGVVACCRNSGKCPGEKSGESDKVKTMREKVRPKGGETHTGDQRHEGGLRKEIPRVVPGRGGREKPGI